MEEQKYTFKIVEEFVVSMDNDERKAGEGTRVTVTFLFEDWTAKELCDRLMKANSVRVSCQAELRVMKTIPAEYTYVVPKPGARKPVDLEAKLVASFGRAKADVWIKKFGSAELVLKAMGNLMAE